MNYEKELELWGSQYGGMVNEAVAEIMELFARQGHSGTSAALVAEATYKLMNHQPLTPLTGEDDEWHDPYGGGAFQNKRYSALFKTSTLEGVEYTDVDAVTFEDVDDLGNYFTNGTLIEQWHKAQPPITFPYVPPTTKTVVRVKEVNGRWAIVDFGGGKR